MWTGPTPAAPSSTDKPTEGHSDEATWNMSHEPGETANVNPASRSQTSRSKTHSGKPDHAKRGRICLRKPGTKNRQRTTIGAPEDNPPKDAAARGGHHQLCTTSTLSGAAPASVPAGVCEGVAPRRPRNAAAPQPARGRGIDVSRALSWRFRARARVSFLRG